MDYCSGFISRGYAYNCKALLLSSTVELYKMLFLGPVR
jgi:hypothetical protein